MLFLCRDAWTPRRQASLLKEARTRGAGAALSFRACWGRRWACFSLCLPVWLTLASKLLRLCLKESRGASFCWECFPGRGRHAKQQNVPGKSCPQPGSVGPNANTTSIQAMLLWMKPFCSSLVLLSTLGAAHGIAAGWAGLVAGVSLLHLSELLKNIAGNMLDLSFLTEEEYEKLMKVLQRDAELKKKDGDRIRWDSVQ